MKLDGDFAKMSWKVLEFEVTFREIDRSKEYFPSLT